MADGEASSKVKSNQPCTFVESERMIKSESINPALQRTHHTVESKPRPVHPAVTSSNKKLRFFIFSFASSRQGATRMIWLHFWAPSRRPSLCTSYLTVSVCTEFILKAFKATRDAGCAKGRGNVSQRLFYDVIK